MYSSHIQEAAAAMADRMNQSPVPLYGSKLRLPNRQAVILLIKEIRKLMFPAYFGDPAAIKEHFSKYLQELRDAPKADGQERIYTHGEKEVAAVKRIMENGIPVNDNTMVEVLDLCNYLGMDFGSYFGDYRPPVKKDVFKGNY